MSAPGGSDGEDDSTDETWAVSLSDLEGETASAPIQPGSPAAENVAFVLLGVVLTLAVIYRIVAIVGTTIG